ncbi:MAG: hypothetical protein ABL907_16595 [Hyphomicrobium sp.]
MKLSWFGNSKQAAPTQPMDQRMSDTGLLPPWTTGERREYIRWWIWHSDACCYRHTTSGEEIRYVGPIAPPDGIVSNWPWHRFNYVHTDLAYPILIEVRDFSRRGGDQPPIKAMNQQLNPIVWKIDHDVCRSVWRHEQNAKTEIPRYGVWLRYEEAFVGAALAWGNTGPFGGRPDEVAAVAGWSNGTWRSELYRRFGYEWKNSDENGLSPFEHAAGGQLKAWFQFGFPAPADYKQFDLDQNPLVWNEAAEVVDEEINIDHLIQSRVSLMRASGNRKLHRGSKLLATRSYSLGESDELNRASLLVLLLPGLAAELSFFTGLYSYNPAWTGGEHGPAPYCGVDLESLGEAVRIDDQPIFESVYGPIHPAEFLTSRPLVLGRASQGNWIQSQVDRPALTRDILCALQDALPWSTGFKNVDSLHPGRSFGAVSEVRIGHYPIAGLYGGAILLRHSLKIELDALDNPEVAAVTARSWTAFFN